MVEVDWLSQLLSDLNQKMLRPGFEPTSLAWPPPPKFPSSPSASARLVWQTEAGQSLSGLEDTTIGKSFPSYCC